MNLNIAPDVLYKIGDFTITNTMTSGLLMTILIVLFALFIEMSIRKGKPTKFQIFCEMIIETFRSFILKIVGNEQLTNRILPIIGAVFIYIGISNILTILPIDWISVNTAYSTEPVAFFRTHTSDVAVAFAIATAIIVWTQIYSIQKYNLFGHINKYFKIGTVISAFKKSKADGFLSLIDFFLLGPLDFISEIAKTVSLSLRLFGNMLAGVFLSALLVAAAPIVLPAFLNMYGLFSGVIQAIVFGALSASYFATAVE